MVLRYICGTPLKLDPGQSGEDVRAFGDKHSSGKSLFGFYFKSACRQFYEDARMVISGHMSLA